MIESWDISKRVSFRISIREAPEGWCAHGEWWEGTEICHLYRFGETPEKALETLIDAVDSGAGVCYS